MTCPCGNASNNTHSAPFGRGPRGAVLRVAGAAHLGLVLSCAEELVDLGQVGALDADDPSPHDSTSTLLGALRVTRVCPLVRGVW